MKSISGKELAKILEGHGWNFLRVRVSHHNLRQAGKRGASVYTYPQQQAFEIWITKAFAKDSRYR